MNVIISNELDQMLSSLNIEVIKKVNGLFSVDELMSMFSNFYYERLIIDITSIKNYLDASNYQRLSIGFDSSKLILIIPPLPDNKMTEIRSNLISVGIYNFTSNINEIKDLIVNPHTYKDVANLHQIRSYNESVIQNNIDARCRIIGIKNLTEHAGSTTFAYLLKKHLEKITRVCCLEIDKEDFRFFNDKNMYSCGKNECSSHISHLSSNHNIVIIDLNNSGQEVMCTDVIYLLEPSIIKINKLVSLNKELFVRARDYRVILNKSLLNPKDINEFEMESNIKTYYSIPPVNDRQNSVAIENLLVRMGFLKANVEVSNNDNTSNSGIFGLFKRRS